MILSVNTSTPEFSIALMHEDGTVLTELLISKGGQRFGNFVPAVHFMFTNSKYEIQDLKGLVVAIGPGSFTGLRVGISFAKGLCHALAVPLIGISSLEAMASQISYTDLTITPVLNSRRGELFTAQFIWNKEHNLIRKMDDISLKFEEFPARFQESTIFIGNNFTNQGHLIKTWLGTHVLLASSHCWNLKASAVGALGLKRFYAGDFDNTQSLDPLYLRQPDIRPTPSCT